MSPRTCVAQLGASIAHDRHTTMADFLPPHVARSAEMDPLFARCVSAVISHKYCTNQRSICVQNERVHSMSSFFTY